MKKTYLLPVLLLLFVAGCGQGQPLSQLGGSIITPTVQSDIQADLPQVLGPAQSYSVTIQGLDTTGHANEVDVTGINMMPPGAPLISSMSAQLLNVNYSISQNQFTQVGPITLTLNLLATDLTNFLVTQKNIPNTQVTFAPPDQLAVVGTPNVPGVGTLSLSIQGHLVPNGAQISYVLDSVQANGQTETDPTILTAVSNLYNPLIDLSSLPLHASVTAIACTSTEMTITATGHFP